MIKLMIVDDHDIVLFGLKTLFEKKSDFVICATAKNAQEAFEKVTLYQPDVILLDMRLPDCDGITVGNKIKQISPNIKVILLTAFDNNLIKLEAQRANLDGFLLKHINSEALYKSVKDIANSTEVLKDSIGTIYPMGKISMKGQLNLSEKEIEILNLISLGKTNKEIAHQLNSSDKTIRNQITNLYQKINVTNRSEAIILWMRMQMLE